MATAEQWADEKEMEQALLSNQEFQEIENDIKVSIIDIPDVHCFQEEVSDKFFHALARVERIELFKNSIISAIIDFKWPLVKKYTIRFLFIPFLLYLAVFIVFSNVLDSQV